MSHEDAYVQGAVGEGVRAHIDVGEGGSAGRPAVQRSGQHRDRSWLQNNANEFAQEKLLCSPECSSREVPDPECVHQPAREGEQR